jgi:hypothetical protein
MSYHRRGGEGPNVLSLSKVDLFVTASGNESARRAVHKELTQRYPLDGERSARFLSGERVLLRGELSDVEAQRIADALRSLGITPAIESAQGSLAMVELDGFTHDEPAPVAAPSSGNNFLFDVNAGLVGLDGSDEGFASPPVVAAPARAPAAALDGLGLMSLSLSDEGAPLAQEPAPRRAPPPAASQLPRNAPPPAAASQLPRSAPPPPRAAPPPPTAASQLPRAAPPPPPASRSVAVAAPPPPPRASVAPPIPAPPVPRPSPAAPAPIELAAIALEPVAAPRPAPPPAHAPAPARAAAPAGAARFAPVGGHAGSSNLELDVVPRDPMMSEPPPPERDTFEVPRCPTHGIARVGGRCASCEREDAHLKSRLFGGSLRHKPPVRLGLGLGMGLVLGWIITTPLARRAESRVAHLREDAQRERSRPTEEAQGVAATIDARADDEASNAFLHTAAIWGLIAAVTTGVWFRLT